MLDSVVVMFCEGLLVQTTCYNFHLLSGAHRKPGLQVVFTQEAPNQNKTKTKQKENFTYHHQHQVSNTNGLGL